MRAIDTNVLIRLIVRDDQKQTERAERFTSRGAWVSHLALVETIWVLTSVYERNRTQIERAVEMILAHETLVVQNTETVAISLALFKASKGVDFSDCMMIATAVRAGHAPLGTFDAKLGRVEDAILI